MKRSKYQNVLKYSLALLFMGIMLTTISCKQNTREQDDVQQVEIDTATTVREVDPRAFSGDLRPVGDSDDNLSGEIVMRVEGDLMRFTVSAEGLSPDMMHLQYLLVSQTGDETQCPGNVEEVGRIEDENNATATSGTTIRRIPLHMGPTSLEMNSDTYPRTNINGELQFSRVVSLDSLETALSTEYNMQDLDFSKLTFVIRGIPDQSGTGDLGNTFQSAQNTPVGCAKLQEIAVED